jgi:hypothetical protein
VVARIDGAEVVLDARTLRDEDVHEVTRALSRAIAECAAQGVCAEAEASDSGERDDTA